MLFKRGFFARFAHKHPLSFFLFRSAGMLSFPVAAISAIAFLDLDTPREAVFVVGGLLFHMVIAFSMMGFFGRYNAANEDIAKKIKDAHAKALNVLYPVLLGTVKKWRRLKAKSTTPTISTPSGLSVQITVKSRDEVDLKISEDGTWLFDITVHNDRSYFHYSLNRPVFVTDDGETVSADMDKYKALLKRFEADVPGLIGAPKKIQPMAAAVDAKDQAPVPTPVVAPSKTTPVPTAAALHKLQKICNDTDGMAGWYVDIADRLSLACTDLLRFLPTASADTAERHTLDDFLLPRLTALLKAAQAFADKGAPEDDVALAALQAALGRLIDHTAHCADVIRHDAVHALAQDAHNAAQVLDACRPLPAHA